jgi:hypothetical protein
MQIKPSEGASAAHLASTRPAAAGQLTLETKAAHVLVSLSGAVRALSTALTPELLDLPELQLGERLTVADRSLLARVSELARAVQLDASEVVKLALDLSRHRAGDVVRRTPLPPLLALPVFSPRDESLARTILSSVALRSSVLERGFVHALLDPEQTPEPTVDFEFVRRIVVALSAAPGDETLDPGVTFEHREARATLGRAITALMLPRADLPAAVAAHRELGASLVRRYLPAALERTPAGPAAVLPDGARDRSALTRDDRTLLSVLYAAAFTRGQDLSAVDDVARALVGLRRLERAASAQPAEPDARQLLPHDSSARPAGPALTAPGPTALPPAEAPPSPAPAPAAETQRHPQGAAPPALPARRDAEAVSSAPRGAADDSMRSGQALRGAGGERFDEPAPARTFGSAAQLAARAGGTYRSLAPPSPIAAGAPASEAMAALPLAAPRATPAFFAAPRPLDLVGALGLSALVRDVRARNLSAARARLPARRTSLVRPIEAPARTASEADADDPVLEDPRARKRVRWRLLLSRRRRGRPRA